MPHAYEATDTSVLPPLVAHPPPTAYTALIFRSYLNHQEKFPYVSNSITQLFKPASTLKGFAPRAQGFLRAP